ncbi:MAG TPA: SLC13 family permease, partial [Elusimicrobiota bacterium]|nr:SLC13 family permease [Elusimicrobiota bacterium]
RPAMAALGAAAMLAFGILSLRQAAASVDAGTIVLLFSMMLIAGTLHLAGFFDWISDKVIAHLDPKHLLPGVVFTSGVLSALLVNDVVCLVMAPLVLDVCRRMRVKPLPYLLALATASNIGSAATITGNPQNILIGSVSGISFRDFAARLGPPAALGLFADWALLHWIYPRAAEKTAPAPEPPPPRRRELHPAWPLAVACGVLAAFLLGCPPPAAAAAGAALMLVQRRRSLGALSRDVDWPLLVLFLGLFVVLGGAERAGVARELLGAAGRLNLRDPAAFAAVVTLLSNAVSNVPTVMLLKGLIPKLFPDPRSAWLLLALTSTLAGNLTITGSVANIIVVEKARGECPIGFLEYLRIGVPVTLATLAIGLLWLRLSAG